MKNSLKIAVATVVACGCFAGVAFAADKAEREKAWEQEWKTESAEKHEKSNTYGAKCQDAFTARGSSRVGLGITQVWAKLRTERHWQQEATQLYGAEYALWRLAKRRSVTCETKDKMLLCKARANACKA